MLLAQIVTGPDPEYWCFGGAVQPSLLMAWVGLLGTAGVVPAVVAIATLGLYRVARHERGLSPRPRIQAIFRISVAFLLVTAVCAYLHFEYGDSDSDQCGWIYPEPRQPVIP